LAYWVRGFDAEVFTIAAAALRGARLDTVEFSAVVVDFTSAEVVAASVWLPKREPLRFACHVWPILPSEAELFLLHLKCLAAVLPLRLQFPRWSFLGEFSGKRGLEQEQPRPRLHLSVNQQTQFRW
jgi:hypothetical protein